MIKLRVLLKIGGSVSVGLAFAGAFLPVLPTTPFVLLAFFLFDHSDPKYREWLINHPRLGPIIKEYSSSDGIEKAAKVKALSVLWLSILVSLFFFISNTNVRIVTLIAATLVSVYILTRKTKKVRR